MNYIYEINVLFNYYLKKLVFKMNKGTFILIYFLLFYIDKIKTIIVLPFQLSELKEDNAGMNYSSTDFFNDFIHIDFYSSINISNSDLKILARITPDNYTFFLSEDECKRNSINNVQNYLIITRKGYKIYNSLSYKNISKLNNNLTNYKNGGIISEIFSFYNTSKLSCQYLSYNHKDDKDIDTCINLNNLKIIIEEYTENKICAVIGMGKPNINAVEEINFINELKRINAIDDYSFTYKYITSTDGQIIIGGLPHEYYDNSKFYKENQFIKINTKYPNNDIFPWSISFNSIFLEKENNEKISIQNNANSFLIPNLGFIIGTIQYKKIIMDNFFKLLIDEGICTLEKISNKSKYYNIKFEIFEIFSCDIYQIKVGHKSSFPKIKFQQNDFEFIFFLNFYYLFMEFKERYYFLVIFPEEKYQNNNWYLGLPFLKRYQFIFNYNSKTIGFYIENSKEKNKTNEIENKKKGNLLNNSHIRIIIEIAVGIILIGLIFGAFFIGKRINNQRKKRANELSDDNFDYFSKENNNPDNPLNI